MRGSIVSHAARKAGATLMTTHANLTSGPPADNGGALSSSVDAGNAGGPRELLELLCDVDSLRLIRTQARSKRLGPRARAGDGVTAGTGDIDGAPVACFAQDSRFLGGSLGAAQAATIIELHRLAHSAGIPIIGCVASAGARLQEGMAALHGYGGVFYEQVLLSGRVPQISYVIGCAAGGAAYSPALSDFVVMRRDAAMFLTGPEVVREVMREDVTRLELGGATVQRRNGVCHFVAGCDEDAVTIIRRLLCHLRRGQPDPSPAPEPAASSAGRFDDIVPAESHRVYDIREVVGGLVDEGDFLEFGADWAKNIVCGLSRLGGISIGVVANQPRRLGGVIDTAASEKAARFVARCSAFELPLLALVDTPGFLPGRRQEASGIVRQGAELVRAFASATVPRITLVLRKAYGGAFIAMNSKALGADLVFAWPSAELGIMGAQPAVRIVHHTELADSSSASDLLGRLSTEYAAEHLRAEVAAQDGLVDEVIVPEETRDRLVCAFRTVSGQARHTAHMGSVDGF
jgi:acetyl-CoA carboxylase carboxyltransferase component